MSEDNKRKSHFLREDGRSQESVPLTPHSWHPGMTAKELAAACRRPLVWSAQSEAE